MNGLETLQMMSACRRPQRCCIAREVYVELRFFVSRTCEPESTRIIVLQRFATHECLARRFYTFEIPTTHPCYVGTFVVILKRETKTFDGKDRGVLVAVSN